MSEATRETKAQRAERLKSALNPWEGYADLVRYARGGYDAIPREWLTTYFRWWGIYTQGDGAGAVGGSGGEGRAVPFFMVRIRVPNGILAAHQARAVADLAERYGRGVVDITVRQNFQLHWVGLQDLPAVVDTLTRAGLTSMGACGDVTRNVTGCPLAGLELDEVADASPLALAVTRMLNGNPDFYNLPRKYKISITGCRLWCSYPEINDVALTALRHPVTGDVGFSLRVGGGLSTDPHLGLRLDAFVRWHQVPPVVKAVTEIFRDSDVLRQQREKARLKFLFTQHGWTPERFLAAVEGRLGFALERAPVEHPPDDVYRDHVGIHPQRQPELCYAGIPVLRGRLTAPQLAAVAAIAERLGGGDLRATTMQNLVITGVRRERVKDLAGEIAAIGLSLGGSPFRRGTIACTGTEFCKLALTETKDFARRLVDELEARMPDFEQHLKIHVTGCPNSCGQHWIADIGIEGKKMKVDGRLVDAYYFCVGGGLGRHGATARPIGLRLPAREVTTAIERLLRAYLARRRDGESFRAFCARHTDDELRAVAAGDAVPAVARDVPTGLLSGMDG